MTNAKRVVEGLPKAYVKELWKQIQEWFSIHPSITPPYVRDTLASNDGSFEGGLGGPNDDDFESRPVVNDHANPIELSESESYMQVPPSSPSAKSQVPPSM